MVLRRNQRNMVFTLGLVLVLGLAGAPVVAAPTTVSPQFAQTMPEVEQALFQAVKARNAAPWVVWIAADTNGHLTIASVGFTTLGPGPDAARRVDARAWRLVQIAFAAVPTLDEVHLSGILPDDVGLELSRLTVTFSAAISRREFSAFPETIRGGDALARLSRVWYASGSTRPRGGSQEAQGTAPTSEHGRSVPMLPVPRTADGIRPGPSLGHGLLGGVSPVHMVFRGDPGRREVAITFDDGPFPIYTTLLLDTLDRLGLKATFFLVGEQVQRYPYFAQAIVKAGHEVGNHTFHHVRLSHLPERVIEEEIASAQTVIFEVTGRRPVYFRPPGGRYAAPVIRTATALGLTTVFWTANSGDYTHQGVAVLEGKILGRVNGGGILLVHQGVGETIRIFPETTEALRRRGLILTTVSTLLAPHTIGTDR